jgi:hypothetical protein
MGAGTDAEMALMVGWIVNPPQGPWCWPVTLRADHFHGHRRTTPWRDLDKGCCESQQDRGSEGITLVRRSFRDCKECTQSR